MREDVRPEMRDKDIEVESQTEKAHETTEEKGKRERVERLLALARKQFATSRDAEDPFRQEAKEATKFRLGEFQGKSTQWPEASQRERDAQGRPCVTINRIPGFIHQVTNAARTAHLRIQVSPVDDKGDPKVAEVLQGIVRNIETGSFADRSYTTASDRQAGIGLGMITIVTEWVDEENSFRQRIRIDQELNPLCIYRDPNCRRADYSDADFAFKVTDVDRESFKDLTGIEPPTEGSLATFEGEGDKTGDWFPNGKVRIAQWVNRESVGERKRIAQLSNGEVIPYPDQKTVADLAAAGVKILRDRWYQKRQLVMRKITATQILEETVWPATAPPWIPVIGEELFTEEGFRINRGLVTDAMGPARLYNVEVSGLIEAVGQGIKAPVVGYTGQFGKPGSPQRKAWETGNTTPHAFLEMDPVTIDGKIAPIGQRVNFSPPLEGIIEAIHQTDEDYKSTAGFRDASLGERGPQESGKAILARQRQDELGSSHYIDNLRFALCAVGRQLIQLIRVIYDVPTVVRITGKDDRDRSVMVYAGADNDPRHERFQKTDPITGEPIPFQMPDGVKELYDLSVGEFDVEVNASPDPGTRRQEQFEAMTALFKNLPPEITVKFLDLYFMVWDTALARQMSERAKKMTGIQDDEQGNQQGVPPQVQAQMEQAATQMQQLQQEHQQALQALQTEKAKYDSQERMKREEMNWKGRIEFLKIKAEIIAKRMDVTSERALVILQAEIERLQQSADHHHDVSLVQLESAADADARAHDAEQADLQRELDAAAMEQQAQAQSGGEPNGDGTAVQ